MRQARWNLTSFPICTNRSQRILTLCNVYFCFPNAITSFQSNQNAQSFSMFLFVLKGWYEEKTEEKNFKIR